MFRPGHRQRGLAKVPECLSVTSRLQRSRLEAEESASGRLAGLLGSLTDLKILLPLTFVVFGLPRLLKK
jgi:hypothetical protein